MFFLLMFTELAVGSCVYQKTLYRFSDFLSSISSGTCQQLLSSRVGNLYRFFG